MNIFVLDQDPKLAALYHCDKHVVKMILESAQLLSTAHRLCGGDSINTYKPTHINHPCSIWVRESSNNYNWLYNLFVCLLDEYWYRYGNKKNKQHKCAELKNILKNVPPNIPELIMTPWRTAMPEECKISLDVITNYRHYYKTHKTNLLNYTLREKPFWL